MIGICNFKCAEDQVSAYVIRLNINQAQDESSIIFRQIIKKPPSKRRRLCGWLGYRKLTSNLKHQVSRCKSMNPRQLDLEVSHAIAVDITFHDGIAAYHAIAQLPSHIAERSGVDHAEGLVAS
jgi:hypothetical protein